MFFQRIKFIVLSTLCLVLILGWQHQLALKDEENLILEQLLTELNQLHNETVTDLEEIHGANEALYRQLTEALNAIEEVEKRNQDLERILFNQRQTYRTAVALQGCTMPVLTKSSFTPKQYERAFSRLRAHGLSGTGAAFVHAEERYGVNSLVLVSIAYIESAGGGSKIAREKNNLFGLGAAPPTPFANALSFSKKEDSIYYTANLLRNSYLSRGGRFYIGDNLRAVNVRYAADPRWAEKIASTMAVVARNAIPEGR